MIGICAVRFRDVNHLLEGYLSDSESTMTEPKCLPVEDELGWFSLLLKADIIALALFVYDKPVYLLSRF